MTTENQQDSAVQRDACLAAMAWAVDKLDKIRRRDFRDPGYWRAAIKSVRMALDPEKNPKLGAVGLSFLEATGDRTTVYMVQTWD